jgi:hypothetical protein
MSDRNSAPILSRAWLGRDESDKLQRGPKWRLRLARAWRALRGQYWVYLRFHCFHCGSGYDVEMREGWHHPLIKRCKCVDPMSLKSAEWNKAMVFPIQSQRQNPSSVHQARTGEYLTVSETKALEERLGYGEKWYETETMEAIQNRYAVRKEHRIEEWEEERGR